MGYAEALEGLGVNVEEGLDRVMGDEELYETMLGLFLEMLEEAPVDLADFDQPEYEILIKRVHSLKGTTGNLSMEPLFEGYTKILGLLRDSKPQEAKEIYEKLLPVQAEIVECIKEHCGKE